MGFPIKDILKNAAPFLATAFAGPFAPLATAVVGKYLGTPDKPVTPDNVHDVVQTTLVADPDAALKLKQAEDEFQQIMAKMGYDDTEKIQELEEKDRESARQREEVVKDRTPSNLAYATLIGFFALLGILLWHEAPAGSHDILVAMTGALAGSYMTQQTYYFGSSAGSESKNKIMSAIMDKLGGLVK